LRPFFCIASILDAKHDDFDITVIWHNLYLGPNSDFIAFRRESQGPIERIMVSFAKALETGLFQLVSLNASKNIFCVTVICEKKKHEGVMDAVFLV
jgi:hypothetical protein